MKLIKWLKFDLFILLILLAFILALSTFTVSEDEVAVVRRFGKITKVVIDVSDKNMVIENLKEKGYGGIEVSDSKGLHFKIPFVDETTVYTSKYLTYISSKETINTLDRRKIDIQMFSQYKVVNPAQVIMTLGNGQRDWNRLQDDRVYPVVIQSANMLRFDDFFNREMVDKVLNEKTKSLSEELIKEYGIAVIDIGIHRKNFPEANINSIEEKMVKEIKKDSEKLRAEGDSQYVKDTSEAERMRQEIIAKGVEEAATIKAQADAEALAVYEQALKKDLEFYRFIQRINTYRSMKGTTIFMDQDNDFLEYINGYN
ncbi:MAG: SPFH domain-containing protein [Bacillota bacterium]